MILESQIHHCPRKTGFISVESRSLGHRSEPHAYQGIGVGHTETGFERFVCGNFDGPVPPDSLVAFGPGQIHWNVAGEKRPTHIRMLYYPETDFDWIAGTPVFQSGNANAALAAATKDIRAGRSCEKAAEKLLAILLDENRFQPPPDRQQIARRLEKARARSTFSFLRAFRKIHGCTPGQYERQQKTRRAAELLLKGTSIADAAIEAGFCDQSHLYRHFTNYYGVTPLEFLKRNSVQYSRARLR